MSFTDFVPICDQNDIYRLLDGEGFLLNDGVYTKEFSNELCIITASVNQNELCLKISPFHWTNCYKIYFSLKPSRFYEVYGEFMKWLQSILSMSHAQEIDKCLRFHIDESSAQD